MGVDQRTEAPGARRDGVAFAALTVFAVVMYTIPSEWIPALAPLRLALISSIIAAGLMLVRRLGKREPFYFDGTRGVALILFGLWALASASWSTHPLVSRTHALEILKLVAIYLTMVNVITTGRRLAIFAGAMVLASIVTSYHIIDSYHAGEHLVEGFRAGWLGVYADPNHMAMDLGIVVPLAVAFLVRRKNPMWMRLLAVVAAGMAMTSMVYSHSRGGFIGMIVALLVWLVLERTRRTTTLMVAGALTVALVLFAPSSFWQRNETVTDFEEDASAMGRVYAWEVAGRMSTQNPIFGVGAGAFVHAWPLYAPPEARTAYVAHNVYLDVVGELGWVGLFLFLIFTGGAASGAFSSARNSEMGWLANGLAGAVAGYVVCSLFSGYTLSAHFYVLFGLAACAGRIFERSTAKAAEPAQRAAGSAGAPQNQQAWEV